MSTTAVARDSGRALILTGDVALLDGRLINPPPARGLVDLLIMIVHALKGSGVALLDEWNEQRFVSDGLSAAHAAGWSGSFYEGWVKLRHADFPSVHIGLLSVLDPHRCPLLEYLPVIEGEQLDAPVLDVDATAAAFGRWAQITGRPWFGTPGVAGWDVLEPMLRGSRQSGPAVTFKPSKPGPADAVEAPYTPRSWRAPADELPYAYEHGYDASRMYLAALGVVEVAPWQLKPTGPMPFDRRLAGWWLIDVPAWNDPRLPDPAGYGDSRRWVTTPTATLLQELADDGQSAGFEVLDSYTGKGRRLFREFATTMETGYQIAKNDQPGASRAFKQAGAREVIGLMNTGGATFSTHRPDWQNAIIALARCNLWRKLQRVVNRDGRWPRYVDTDCIWYGSDLPDPVAACPSGLGTSAREALGDQLGQFKVKGSR